MTEHPICPRCSQPVFVGAYVCAEQGQVFHLLCVNEKTIDRAKDRMRQPRAQAAWTTGFVRPRKEAS